MEAPGQHCYRIFVDVMSIKSMHSIHMLQFKMSRNVAAAPKKNHCVPKLLSTDQACVYVCVEQSKAAMISMYFSLENERLPLQLVAMRIRFVRCAISTFVNEHLIRLSIVSL